MFDISVLGFGHATPLYRGGIFRVVQQIAFGLAASDEVELTLSAGLMGSTVWEHFRNLEASLAYRESDKVLGGVSVAHSELVRSSVRVLGTIGRYGGKSLRRMLYSPTGQTVLGRYLAPVSGEALDKVDVFHSPACPLPAFTASVRGLKRFLTVHDMLPALYPHFFDPVTPPTFEAVLKSLRPTDWVLCDSENTRNDFCEYLHVVDRSQVLVALLAADPDLFYPCRDEERVAAVRRKYNIPEGPYVLSVCTVERRKNLDHVVRCFADLVRQQKIGDLNLVLVGALHEKSQAIFNQIISSGDVRNRIVLTGHVNDEDLAAIYSSALLFVYPSLAEGFGLPPLEAMQCGVPVVASHSTSLPEVVGDAGILIDPRDPDALCSSMLRIYESPSLRTAMSESSIARASQFSWQRCVRQIIDAYKLALAS